MATHSHVLSWRIPGMGDPGGLPSVGSHRVGHDWSDLAAAAAVWSKAVIPKLKEASKSWWGELVKMWTSSLSQSFWFCRSGEDPRISKKFPGGADVLIWGPHFENHCYRLSWEPDRSDFVSQFYFHVIWQWTGYFTSYFTSLNLSFLTCKKKIRILTTSQINLQGFNKMTYIC